MWVSIVFAVIGILIVLLCIGSLINMIWAKKNPKKEETLKEKTPIEHESEITNAITKILDQILSKQRPLTDKLTSINDKTMKIQKQTHTILMEYIATVDRKNVDSDFAKLLSIYEKRQNSVNDEYLTALQKCKDKDLKETKKLCDCEEERQKLKEDFASVAALADEWSDVSNLKARDVWSNPECEELYNQLYALKNDLYALKNDVVYKERKEKEGQWKEYSKRCIIGRQGSRICYIGRNGDNIAIWDIDYNGQIISIDDIIYFQVSEKTITKTYTSSARKSSKLGTAINEAIWGTAAATASAMQKNQQDTTTFTNTQLKAMIYFKFELGVEPFEVSLSSEVNKLVAMMPEKQR